MSSSDKQSGPQPNGSSAYYDKGSSELAEDTPLTLRRLETRRKLTRNYDRLVICLVGLPARGKSFVARKLQSFLTWYGIQCKIFNVGRYRRAAHAATSASNTGACDANFFDSKNKEAAALREKVAELALVDMLKWLDNEDSGNDSDDSDKANHDMDTTHRSATSNNKYGPYQLFARDRIAIFDATNSTVKRRKWLLEQCTSPEKRPGKPTGMVFVESICDDEELLMENFKFKISNSPDYKGVPKEEAIEDLTSRVRKYEEQYETITDDSLSYIKIFNLSTKLLVNHIYGRMSKVIVPALMAWNIGTRPVFLCRPGQTLYDITTDGEDYVAKVDVKDVAMLNMSAHSKRRLLRGDTLGPSGKKFSDALYNFVFEEGTDFLERRASTIDMANTGTSISGLAAPMYAEESGREPPFPIKIFTSTMPRAVETVRWEDDYDFVVEELSNLNPLDKGHFGGKELEEIQTFDPAWYERLEKDPFRTRFPGGESYCDLIRRLESCVVDIEQQVIPTLVVSHVSILQILIAYFRGSPVQKCMGIEVPLHTVLKFTPARGGGWSETQHPLCPVDELETTSKIPEVPSISEMSAVTFEGGDRTPASPTPIWGDHMRKLSNISVSSSGSRHGPGIL